MKLNLIEWNRVVEALRIAATVSHADRDKEGVTPADNRKHYVKAQNFTALADMIETADRT